MDWKEFFKFRKKDISNLIILILSPLIGVILLILWQIIRRLPSSIRTDFIDMYGGMFLFGLMVGIYFLIKNILTLVLFLVTNYLQFKIIDYITIKYKIKYKILMWLLKAIIAGILFMLFTQWAYILAGSPYMG